MSYVSPNRQEVMSEELSQDILNVKAIGSEIYNALRQERLVNKSKNISTIHRTNIRGLNTNQKKQCTQKSKYKTWYSWICLQTNCRYHNGKGVAIKLVLPCDVSQKQYLFDEHGFMVWIGKNLVESPTPHLTHNWVGNMKSNHRPQISQK